MQSNKVHKVLGPRWQPLLCAFGLVLQRGRGQCGPEGIPGCQVAVILAQAEATAAASSGPEDAQYEEVPYVLVYATVSLLLPCY